MRLKNLLKYGLIAIFTLGTAVATEYQQEDAIPPIPTHQSLLDIKAAYEMASFESRELHIILGAYPNEEHMVELRKAEEKQEEQEGIKAPIKIFFCEPYSELHGQALSTPKTPIVSGNFNKEESWNIIIEALDMVAKEDTFNGIIDKIYFDYCTAYFTFWNESIFTKIGTLLKKSGGLYIPDAKLYSESTFCDSVLSNDEHRRTYERGTAEWSQKQAAHQDPAQKDVYTRPHRHLYNPQNMNTPFFVAGSRGMTPLGRFNNDEKIYFTNNLTLIYDTIFQNFKGYPLKFEYSENEAMYPDIGMQYRPELQHIPAEQRDRIERFVSMQLRGE